MKYHETEKVHVTWINTECTLHQQCLDIYGEPRLYGNGETDETMPSPVKSMLTFTSIHNLNHQEV